MRAIGRIRANQAGNVGIIFSIAAVIVAGIAGMGVDFARMMTTARKLQDASDAAALGATLHLARDPSLSVAAIKPDADAVAGAAFASTNNKDKGAAFVAIESASPAQVMVRLGQKHDLVFGGFFGMKNWLVEREARAVAGKGYPLCLLVLSPSASDAWTASGTSDVKAPKCAAQVNSTSRRALSSNGSAKVTTLRTLVTAPEQRASAWTPKPDFSQQPVPDPYAGKLPWPSASSPCVHSLGSLSKLTKTISAGVICGGIDIGNGGVLKLAPGVYPIRTGGITVKSGGVLDASAGATLVLLDPSATVNMQAGGGLKLTAVKDGAWGGIAVAIKPQPTELTSTMIGGGELALDGLVYMPSQRIRLTGGGRMDKGEAARAWIVNRIAMDGNGQIVLSALNGEKIMAGQSARLVR